MPNSNVSEMIALPSTHDLVRSVPPDAEFGKYAFVHGGPLFWVNLGYSYVLIIAAIGLLVQDLVRVSSRYGRQAWTLIISVLVPLMGPEIAQRLLNNELKVRDRSDALTVAELYGTLHRAIFSEIATRRGKEEEREDILSMMMAARYDDGGRMSDAELRDDPDHLP